MLVMLWEKMRPIVVVANFGKFRAANLSQGGVIKVVKSRIAGEPNGNRKLMCGLKYGAEAAIAK